MVVLKSKHLPLQAVSAIAAEVIVPSLVSYHKQSRFWIVETKKTVVALTAAS